MGFKPDWQQSSYAKGSSIPKVTQKGNIISQPLFHHQPSRLSLADGGSVDDETYKSAEYQADKKAGLEASKNEKVSLWERLKMGNIDAPGSRAYNELGAGRGKMEREKQATFDAQAKEFGPEKSNMVDAGKTMRKAQGMGDMDSIKRVEESASKPEGVFSNPTITKSGLGEEPEVRKFEPEPLPQPKKLRDETEDRVRPYKPVKSTPGSSQRFPLNDNRDLPSKPYPNVGTGMPSRVKDGPRKEDNVDRTISRVTKDTSGVNTAYGQKDFSFSKNLEAGKKKAAEEKAEAERKARSRKAAAEVRYDEMGNPY